jgi:Protein of unknown function (DUF1501)
MRNTCCNRRIQVHSRREFLEKSSFGFGAVALGYLLNGQSALASNQPVQAINPLAPKPPQFPAKAKHVIFIFMQGGPSHVDTFDPKPTLSRLEGQPLPPSFLKKDLSLAQINAKESKLMGSRRTFKKYGQSGLEVSDLFENVAKFADDIAVIRSCYHESFIHGPALSMLHSGSLRLGYPSLGSWVLYGLGSESQNLPAYMVMSDSYLRSSKSLFGSGFLPASYQGTMVNMQGSPFENLVPPTEMDPASQQVVLDQVKVWNERHLEERPDDSSLAARINNFELAFKMQVAGPELTDISKEPESIKKLYGMETESTAKFGRMCLLARRMVERGVRFVHLYSSDWDGHQECDKNHLENARKMDIPVAGLLADLKQRGLLESTLIVSAGEFGRTPVMQGNAGRDHHPYGFSTWMAGGGIKGGKVIGATDEIGWSAVEEPMHVHDIHGTILGLLGLDHMKLTYFFSGRDMRLTGVGEEGSHTFAKRLLEA